MDEVREGDGRRAAKCVRILFLQDAEDVLLRRIELQAMVNLIVAYQ